MMKDSTYFVTSSSFIHLAIAPNRLEALIREGRLNVTDFNCLDKPSKRSVWAMLRALAACKLEKS
jgi:hypothetical protein